MKSNSLIVRFALFGSLLTACNSQEQVGPVDYSRVQQIFDSRCAGSSCHVGVSDPRVLGGDLNLSAAQAAPCLLNVPSSGDPQKTRVVPGDSGASYLLCKLDPTCQSITGARMPVGGELTPDELALLRAWIQQGAQGGASGTCGSNGADTTAPTFAGATGATSAPNSIRVNWNAATDDVTQPSQLVYLLYQSTTSGGQNYAAPTYTSTPGVISYSVGKLAISTQYYFVVRARDQAGNIDSNKIEVSAMTPATSDTQAPTFSGLATASASGTTITLSWTAASDNYTPAAQLVYSIYQATSAGGETYATPTYVTAPGATTYQVTGLTANTTYYFVVRAQDGAGNLDMNTVEKNAKTGSISFTGQVQPIFTANCTGGACHSGNMPAQGLNLSTASVAYSNLVNTASSECPTTKRVLPNQPDMSYLVWKLQGTGPCFSGSRMPKGQPLAATEISTIRNWVLAGAPNN